MAHKIGKIKVERTTLTKDGELTNPSIVATESTLDTLIYDDITSIESWNRYGGVLCTDGYQVKTRISEVLDVSGWSGITSDAKDIVISYYLKETNKDEATANTEKVVHLMGKGYTLQQAQGALVKAYANYHLIEIGACYKRANSEQLFMVIAKYLTLTDAGDLIKITHKLFDLYKTQGIRGISDGSAGEGLFDFLESSIGTSYETTGLAQQGYVLNTGDNATFISELMDVLRNGNY